MINKESHSFTKTITRWGSYLTVSVALGTMAIFAYRFLKIPSSTQPIEPTAQSSPLTPTITNVAALGNLVPQGEITRLSAPASLEGTKIEQVLVEEGNQVKKGEVVAILDTRKRRLANLEQAQADVQVAQANLAIVKAGAKTGDIQAQKEQISFFKAELEGQIRTQQANIAQLEAQLYGEKTAQEAAIERIQAELANAQEDCRRYQTLYNDGAVSVQERDRFCLQAETTAKTLLEAQTNLYRIILTMEEKINEARANLRRTIFTLNQQIKENQATLDSISEVRPVDVQLAEAELQKAIAVLGQAQEDLALTYIRSPLNGQVLKVHVRPGEVINSQGIAEIAKTSQMYVVSEVYETDISRVKLGQKAVITSPAFSGKLEGKVDEIALQVQQQTMFEEDPFVNTDNKVVEVKIRLNEQSSRRVSNLSNLQVQVMIMAE